MKHTSALISKTVAHSLEVDHDRVRTNSEPEENHIIKQGFLENVPKNPEETVDSNSSLLLPILSLVLVGILVLVLVSMRKMYPYCVSNKLHCKKYPGRTSR